MRRFGRRAASQAQWPENPQLFDTTATARNKLAMNVINPLTSQTQDDLRVGAWAEVRELLELQLAPLGRAGLSALAPAPGECILDIGCGGGETVLDLARAVAPAGQVSICRLRCLRSRNARPPGANT